MADPEFEPLAIPPLDDKFLSSDDAAATMTDFLADPDLGFDLGLELFDENWDCDLSLDDIGEIDGPGTTEADGFLIPEAFDQNSLSHIGADPAMAVKSDSPESGSSAISGIGDCDVAGFLNYSELADRETSRGGDLNSNSPGSGLNCDQEFSGGPVSSHSSGNCGSGVSEGENSPVHSVFVDKKLKPEVMIEKKRNKNCFPKRKKEAVDEEEGNSDLRTPKYRKSSAPSESIFVEQSNMNSPPLMDDDDDKRKARLMRNRESAQLSRQRKKHYVEELEDKVRIMNSTIADLNGRISYIMAENASLRQQMSGGGGRIPPPPPPGMIYPHPAMGPMAYPWVPCSPYVMKPQGSHVPLVPIPRLKPQPKKSEVKKSQSGKTKKVASISFLGLLFFVLLFGGLVPIVNDNFGVLSNEKALGGFGFVSGRLYDQHRGRVLTVDDGSNRSGENVGVRHNNKEKGSIGNGSEPLVASLYVPRNDKMVKIDGNLIIHSVLASEKTKTTLANLELKKNTETRLAIARNIHPSCGSPENGANPARRVPLYSAERQKALSSGADDSAKNPLKSSTADNRLQQWFREGLAGPMLSSGMCTEVFQFDVSPTSTAGAIVSASSVADVSSQNNTATKNNTRINERKNRRTLHRLPVPLSESNYNITEEQVNRTSQKDDFKGNRSVSSMIVSVLVDPREATDAEIDGVIKPKSLSRIFVVVLMDSVKYVTYSCVLPRATTHLVTA